MDTAQVISLIGALGVGSLIGVLAKMLSDKNLSDKKMLFEARIRAYSGITGRVFNLFLEPDITILKEDSLILAKLNQLLSEAMLVSGHKLCELLTEYKIKVFEFHCALSKKKNDEELKKIHSDLALLGGKIHIHMRKELHIDDKSIYEEISLKIN